MRVQSTELSLVLAVLGRAPVGQRRQPTAGKFHADRNFAELHPLPAMRGPACWAILAVNRGGWAVRTGNFR